MSQGQARNILLPHTHQLAKVLSPPTYRDPEQLLTVSKVQFTPDWEGTVADHGTWRVALGRIGHEHVWR
ncbi:unnamed protein product [Clonostachys rosea f. rosea IK726]|uniref:Uncharacterized protein n=2 Tax=Bionectria ochroleuca TaxID=29856 RepID=A0A0B7KCH0_BIOOC|nr:unnamed protein product [Clonostachys rosea f. rosea IK726]